jgi:hypothetical protein
METFRKYYLFSTLFAIAAVIAGYVIGGLATAWVVAVLGALEISLSFDNAIANARVLRNWDHAWRQRFLLWGMIIAVFGMRVVFPLGIVSVTTGIAPFYFPGLFGESGNILSMSLNQPEVYSGHLTAVHHEVAGFGGAFLFMVAFGFFFEERHVHWLEAIETRLTSLGQIEGVAAAITLIIAYIVSKTFGDVGHGTEFFMAAVWGVITFVIAHGIGSYFGSDDDDEDGAEDGVPVGKIIKAGIGGFIYLEIMDASFSFDGVIGAFVLSNYLPVIALGLAIGAFFVRSMTIHLVETKTLAKFPFLEHGAFWAILALASIMFASGAGHELPNWLVGLISIAFIGAALVHSVIFTRKEAAAAPAIA